MPILQPGQMLGPYQITSQIGKGGMATVYKAYQPSMDRYVALKVVAGQFVDDPTFMDRFRQEARVIARLEHPHILPVYDFGESDGTPYMVMRFLEAGTLTERLDAGRLSLEEIDHIFSQLTDALGYAHEKGVIHRDIKPSNAMLDNRGDVFLTDFGIAKIIEGSAGLTATGAITGTPSYMSPEQAQGKKVDQRSDIYSLGIMLFEMLTGRVPFEAETPMAVLFRQIQDPPPPLSTVRPDLPYTLEMVLLKALTKDPDHRYPSMSAFRRAWKDALAEAAASAPASAVQPPSVVALPVTVPPPVEPPPPPAVPAKKSFNWKRLVLIGLPLCLILLCLAIGFVFRTRLLAMFPRLRNELRSTQVENANELPTTAAAAAAPPATIAPAVSGVSSWVAANSVFSIAFRGDEVLTAGAGGLTIWNRKDDSFKQLTTANGLPSGNAGVVFVDTDKSLWVGTDAGIAHIESDESTVYDTDDGLDANYIVAIARSGDLLFTGTQYTGNAGGGLSEFDGTDWKPVPGFPSAAEPDEKTVSCNVHQIVADAAGNIWVATDSGIARLNVKDQQWTVFKTDSGLSDNTVFSITIDPAGNLFAGTAKGGVVQFNDKKQVFESYLDLNNVSVYDVYGMLTAQDGTEWFAGGNVARYKPDTRQWKSFSKDNDSFPAYSVTSMAMDDQGVLYFGTNDSGLVRYVNGKFEKLLVPNALHYGQYGRIVPAPDGKLIFAQLYSNGADQFDPASNTWTKVPSEQDIPRAFDKKGQMWSGSGDGLWIFGADKNTHITKDQGLPSNEIYGVVFGTDGTAYIATGAGVAVFDGTKVTAIYTKAKNGLISDLIFTLFMASDGSLWVGEEGGFSRRLPDGTWQHYTPDSLFGSGSSQYFLAFVEDDKGNMWVPTYGDGLYLFPKTGKPTRILSDDPGVGLNSDYLNAAALAPDGALWLGTEEHGVVRYDGKTWKSYTVKDGLLANSVDGIYIEPDGVIWFATTGGISRMKP